VLSEATKAYIADVGSVNYPGPENEYPE